MLINLMLLVSDKDLVDVGVQFGAILIRNDAGVLSNTLHGSMMNT